MRHVIHHRLLMRASGGTGQAPTQFFNKNSMVEANMTAFSSDEKHLTYTLRKTAPQAARPGFHLVSL